MEFWEGGNVILESLYEKMQHFWVGHIVDEEGDLLKLGQVSACGSFLAKRRQTGPGFPHSVQRIVSFSLNEAKS